MAEQKALFGFEEMRPKLSLKKIITRERMAEIQEFLKKNDGKSAAERLRDLNDELQKLERRVSDGTCAKRR